MLSVKLIPVFCVCFVYPESGGNGSSRELQRLKKKNVQLEEENNLLKLKIEVLLDMVRTKQLLLCLYSLSHIKEAIYIFIHRGRNV